jgi:hypothetical protein
MKFRFLKDKLFLTCLVLYFINRWVFKNIFFNGFLQNYFNDLICIPFWVPVLLSVLRRLKLRKSDAAPDIIDVLVPTLVWSYLFEVLLPRLSPRFVGDPWDVFCYATGGLLALTFWRWRYKATVA